MKLSQFPAAGGRWATLLALCFSPVLASGPDWKPVTQEQALKLGPEDLTQFTDPSEVGQDHAAWLYAIALRVATEQKLARQDLQRIIDLNEWRQAIAQARGGAFTLAYIVNGGGTMYTHGHARDVAAVEDFLAELAGRLPLAEGKGDPKAAKQIDDTIALFKTVKPFDEGLSADEKRRLKARMADEIKRVTESWTVLKNLVERIPAEDARRIVEFATGTIAWLKEDEGR